jgi:hypothetical protein
MTLVECNVLRGRQYQRRTRRRECAGYESQCSRNDTMIKARNLRDVEGIGESVRRNSFTAPALWRQSTGERAPPSRGETKGKRWLGSAARGSGRRRDGPLLAVFLAGKLHDGCPIHWMDRASRHAASRCRWSFFFPRPPHCLFPPAGSEGVSLSSFFYSPFPMAGRVISLTMRATPLGAEEQWALSRSLGGFLHDESGASLNLRQGKTSHRRCCRAECWDAPYSVWSSLHEGFFSREASERKRGTAALPPCRPFWRHSFCADLPQEVNEALSLPLCFSDTISRCSLFLRGDPSCVASLGCWRWRRA